MAASKSQKIQAEIEKVKAKINEQQARLKELEKNKLEAENSEIVDIVRGMSIPLAELPQGAGEGALLHFTPAGWQRAEQEERARRRSMAAKVRNLFGKNPFRE